MGRSGAIVNHVLLAVATDEVGGHEESSYSGAMSNNCVEIAALPNGGRAVRDSKNPEGVLTAGQWAELAKSLLLRERSKPPNRRGSGACSHDVPLRDALGSATWSSRWIRRNGRAASRLVAFITSRP